MIQLDDEEAAPVVLGGDVAMRRKARPRRGADLDAVHHHFAGASLAVTRPVPRGRGPGVVASLEDAAFETRLREHGTRSSARATFACGSLLA